MAYPLDLFVAGTDINRSVHVLPCSYAVQFTLKEGAIAPVRSTDGSAGYDVFAYLKERLTIPAGEHRLVTTGLSVAIPKEYFVRVSSRSGLALKHGVVSLEGTIDSDYRGEVGVVLFNHSKTNYFVQNGDRVAQLLVLPVVQIPFVQCKEIENTTQRGVGGFGSTGV